MNVPGKRPIISEIGEDFYEVSQSGLDSLFVICGTQKALAVDMGMGYRGCEAIIRKITDLPYTAVVSHRAAVHAGGFDGAAVRADFRGDVRLRDDFPETEALYDGRVFDLGGRKVTAFYVPGHSDGDFCFMDDKSRILILGGCSTGCPSVTDKTAGTDHFPGFVSTREMRMAGIHGAASVYCHGGRQPDPRTAKNGRSDL